MSSNSEALNLGEPAVLLRPLCCHVGSCELAVVIVSAHLDPCSASVQRGATDTATGERVIDVYCFCLSRIEMIGDDGLSLSQS